MPDQREEFQPDSTDLRKIIRLIRTGCMKKNWDLSTLAEKAGISRTTLYLIEQGKTSKPQMKTLRKVFNALDIDPQELDLSPAPAAKPFSHSILNSVLGTSEKRKQFDQLSNSVVVGVQEDQPELFLDWKEVDWNELYSHFGTGGQLTKEGVVISAKKINEKKETMTKVELLMETHHRQTIMSVIDSLFKEVNPQSNLALTDDLSALIQSHFEEKE